MDAGPDPMPMSPAPHSTAPIKQRFGNMILATYAQTLMLAALGAAVYTKNWTLLTTLAGLIAANATQVINFYYGSSASSQSKDDTISKQLPK